MKKFSRKYIAKILSFVMMIAFSLNTYAAGNQENQMIAISNNPYVIIDDNGNEMIFASIEDFEIYQDANSNKQASVLYR